MPDSLQGEDWRSVARTKQPEGDISQSWASERGRGRAANRPSEIPFRGWRDIFWRLIKSASDDRILATSGSVAFFALLAAFPAVATVVSLYGIFADAHTIDKHLMLLSGFLPTSGIELLGEEMKRIAGQSSNKLGLAFAIASAIALWSANSGMVALFDALNLVYKEREKRSLVRLYCISLLFTLLAVGFIAIAVGAVVVLPIFLNLFGLGTWNERLIAVARWPFLLVGSRRRFRSFIGTAQPASGEMALGDRKPHRGGVMAPYVNAVLLVRYAFRQLQSSLRIIGCRCRVHDVDVVLRCGRPGWGRTEC